MDRETIKVKDIIVSGFALFAIFFGAGNLVLPPYIGLHAGKSWIPAWIGFGLSGPGLTCLGMIAMAKNQGEIERFAGKISYRFSILLGSLAILCIGPLMSVPRTGATTYEIAIQPFFPNFSPILFAIIFFGITLYFAINRSTIIDIIGTYMTPILLIILLVIIFKGIFTSTEAPTVVGTNQFSVGFLEGYHTMDSLGPLVLAGMIISNFRQKGIKSEKTLTRYTIYTELIAATGLLLIYGGLTYLGSIAFNIVPEGVGRTELLNTIVNRLLGGYGNVALGLVVAFACLTTAIGLISATGDFFSRVTKNKLKYQHIVIVSIIVSGIISIIGVDGIINFSLPTLVIIYPVVVALVILNLVDEYIRSDLIYKTTVFCTLAVSLVSGIETAGFENFPLVRLFSQLPLWEIGFSWILAALVGLILGLILSKFSEQEEIVEG